MTYIARLTLAARAVRGRVVWAPVEACGEGIVLLVEGRARKARLQLATEWNVR